jgi:hypothetical protein
MSVSCGRIQPVRSDAIQWSARCDFAHKESELIEQYRAQFSEPPWPPFSNHTEDEVVAWARQGLAQGHPIKWEELFAPLPLGTCS